MRNPLLNNGLVIGIILLCVGTSFLPGIVGTVKACNDTITSNSKEDPSRGCISGQILFAPMGSKITYLIDNNGVVNHTWSSGYLPGVGVRWLGDGTILRTIRVGMGPGAGGAGGGVQKIQWDGTVVWDFRYNTNGYLSHHDVKPLPNGNVLMIAWETKTRAEAIAAGRNPNYVSSKGFYPDHIIEVQPTGPTSGMIVWEWHVWDHLIQDYDSSKANYGVVGDHPELVDINYRTISDSDWMHTNSIDYNKEFDQILISVCYLNEIWVIDHSTTTAEAAGHTGGNSGKGGDLLYRWGNPAAYRAGTLSDQKFFGQHDATWIDDGCPGTGHILVFNNGNSRPGGSSYSSVDEIAPPVNEQGEYYRALGSAYGPAGQTWIYTASPPISFLSVGVSGAERLANGNTLICSGTPGKFFEVTPAGTTVWSYTNIYPSPVLNNVFKIVYISPEEVIPNHPPDTPSTLIPANGAMDIAVNIDLRWTGGDPDVGDTVVYDVYFGTSSPPSKVSTGQSGTSYDPGLLGNNTSYYWQIVARDSHSASTSGPIWDFTTGDGSNNPPNTPIMTGETNGDIQTLYEYTIHTTDPDQNTVEYLIDWGDTTNTTTDFHESGEEVIVSHIWNIKGIYYVTVKAIDEYYAESDWATLTVTMPCSYIKPIPQFFELLFERFQNKFLILRHLLEKQRLYG